MNRRSGQECGSRFLSLHTGCLLALMMFCGCYEIRPELPENYIGSQARPGWPPPAVYSSDPFHPANRLYQRLFVFGGREASNLEGDEGISSPAWKEGQFQFWDAPFSPREVLSAADRAEVLALLEVLSRESGGDSYPEDPILRGILQSDLLSVACRLNLEGEIQKELARAALHLAWKEIQAPPDLLALPPPLRKPGWKEIAGPRRRGLSPSPADFRWTRVFRCNTPSDSGGGVPKLQGGSNSRESERALLRLRIGVRPDGAPVLLPIGSEAWFLASSKAGLPHSRIFRFHRVRLLRGEDPWEEVPGGEVIAIRNPEDPGKSTLKGKAAAVCSSCHRGPSLEPGSPAEKSEGTDAPFPPERQLQDARRALRSLFPKGE